MTPSDSPQPAIAKDVYDVVRILGADAASRFAVLAIDGVSGASKSALGAQLCDVLDAVHIDFDCYVIKGQNKYFDALRWNDLRKAFVALRTRPLIASGVCALRVLDALDTRVDVLIYVKRMAQWGWADSDEAGLGLSENACHRIAFDHAADASRSV